MNNLAHNFDSLLTEDSAARLRALALESFIVEAPAGAGKTELLTQRYLRLLSCVEAPEEIVAITFTNKAASEMGSRIIDSLRDAAAGVPVTAPHKQITRELALAALAASQRHGWGLLDHPGRLRVTTIDALCLGLARQMPLLSRFGSQPRLAEEAGRHYAEAARRALSCIGDDDANDNPLAEIVAEALRHLDNDAVRLTGLLAEMLACRDQWLRHALTAPSRDAAEHGFALLIERELARVAAVFDHRRQSLLMPTARFAADNLAAPAAASGATAAPIVALRDWREPLGADTATLPQWQALCALLLTAEGKPRKAWNKNNGLPAEPASKPHKEALAAFVAGLAGAEAELLARVRELPEPRYTDEEWSTVVALSALLRLAAAELWAVFNAAGETDFIEVAARARLALGDAEAPTDLALALDYRIRHLLVDEFQDTSPTQVDLLERLTAGWTMDGKAGEQAGDVRTLFAVGDPMQSIYRFRKADVGLFLRVADLGVGELSLTRLRLTRNNRSHPAVIEWINEHCRGIFPPEDSVFDGAIAYRPFAATRAPLAGTGVFVHPLVVARDLPEAVAEAREAATILAIIDGARAADPHGRVAVLVRARRHLDALVATLRRERPDLPFQAVEIEPLAQRQPVQDLLSLTHALYHRADRVQWLAILRAPWCGLTLADLHVLAGDDHAATIWQLMQDEARLAKLTPSGQRRLLHVRGVIAAAFAQRGRQRPRRWIESSWLRLGGAGCLASEGDVADATAFLDLIDRLDAAGGFALDELERQMARLYAAPAAAAGDSLQFMTIHKAKGLEFDTVIVPGLHRTTGGNGEQKLVRWEEVAFEGTAESLVAAPIQGRGRGLGELGDNDKDAGAPSLHDYLRLLDATRADNEDVRALYVAATRAIRALHWVGVATPKADDTLSAPAGSFLRLLWPALAADFESAPVIECEGEPADAATFVAPLRRLVEPVVPERLRGEQVAIETCGEKVGEKVGGSGTASPSVDTASEGATLAADVGTLIHAYLEMIAREGAAAWPLARLTQLLPAMAIWLGQQGHASKVAADGAQRTHAALRTTLASEAGRWVLAARPEAAAELALTAATTGRIATHVVDRTFVENGTRWIIDYKTTLADKIDEEGALAAHAERYRPQLERYAALFADEGVPIKMAIFYANIGRLVELPWGGAAESFLTDSDAFPCEIGD